jgi:FAD/FMN-containing dehydrogenase/Fe-S oxidoreductase
MQYEPKHGPDSRSAGHPGPQPAPRGDTALALRQGAAVMDGTLAEVLARNIQGEVCFDAGSRAMYATDASNYRQPPIGVVLPRDADDVIRTVEICRARRAPILGRGAGTSLAGQCCNEAVVLDFSRYMNRVIEIDPERRVARVQPGVVLDDLNKAARDHGLEFGPDPSTHGHCTLGGMIGNNSCGVHSVQSEFYGPGSRTSDHVVELDIVTYEGVRMRVGQTSDEEFSRIIEQGGPRARIYAALRALGEAHAGRIRERFPDIPRRVSGYNLPDLLPECGFHVARALVGSESTCVLVVEATLQLMPAKPMRTMVVLGYPSVFEAADHIPRIRDFKPVGCEGIDDRLIEYMRMNDLNVEHLGRLPEGGGWLLVEFGGDTQDEANEHARTMMAALEAGASPPSMVLYDDPAIEEHIWKIRESGLGATAFVPGQRDTWPGWEDSAVPPDRVGPYLRELHELIERYGYQCSLYGHFAHGCVHMSIDFDFSCSEGIERFRRFTEESAELALSHGGSLSGEHGDGQARGDLLVKMYGDELVRAFCEFKAIWDPEGGMNPGKVVDASSRVQNLRLAQYQPFQAETYFHYPEDEGDFSHTAMRCVGVGKCRRRGGGTMCPSYMVTCEEKHTTRGRARLLFEMMQGEVITDRWQSEEVKDALDLCLACKGCKRECPVNVDMATYKAEFLAHYYQGHRRPRHAYAFGWIHRWARAGSWLPRLSNFFTQTAGVRVIAKRMAGMTTDRELPRFARRTFRRMMARRRTRKTSGPEVILWADTFNNYFHPGTLMAAAEVLERAGYQVVVPRRPLCCGRALYDYGMLDLARKLWEEILSALAPHVAAGTPVVAIEPSCAAAFRDELRNLFPGDDRAARLAENTHTLGEFLINVAEGYQVPGMAGQALVHGHCHHKAIMTLKPDLEVLERMGLDFEVLDSGCCGMAGAFGFESEHYDVSMAAGERVLFPAVRGTAADTMILADGFSCREQIRHGTERSAMHLAELLRSAYE